MEAVSSKAQTAQIGTLNKVVPWLTVIS